MVDNTYNGDTWSRFTEETKESLYIFRTIKYFSLRYLNFAIYIEVLLLFTL